MIYSNIVYTLYFRIFILERNFEMSNLNTDILIQNINRLMKENNITQEKLAEILGMSQPNVSKALSLKDKKCFTLDQVIGIAKHFGVSIDLLIGNTVPKSLEICPRSVARFLTSVIESHDARYTTIEVEEEVYCEAQIIFDNLGVPDTKTEIDKKTVSYPAIYFPDYWKVPTPESESDEKAFELIQEAYQIGNGTRMIPLNDYLRKFIQLFEIHEGKGIDDDAYQFVIESYQKRLSEH